MHLGSDPGRAGAHDVALLDISWTALTGVVHAFALARAEGITARDLAPYAKGITALLPDVIDASRSRGVDSTVISAAHDIALRGMTAGYADDSYAHVADLLRD
ncbi:imine reductase family protein [Streptomyces sp. BA2]|uniref:imine reductase family protein n=1 Tax=Streptomyces sp. BA2 TaxID=436595 RepID=UPI00301499E4